MERVWLIVVMLCLFAAAFFLWRGLVADEAYINAAFVAATLGILAWFIRLRSQLQNAIPGTTDLPADEQEEVDNQDEN